MVTWYGPDRMTIGAAVTNGVFQGGQRGAMGRVHSHASTGHFSSMIFRCFVWFSGISAVQRCRAKSPPVRWCLTALGQTAPTQVTTGSRASRVSTCDVVLTALGLLGGLLSPAFIVVGSRSCHVEQPPRILFWMVVYVQRNPWALATEENP